MSLFIVLKLIHVLSAIVAVGGNATYGVLLASGAGQTETTLFSLKAIRFIDRYLANPAYTLLLLAGLTMVFTVPFPITTPWILTSLILYIVIAILGATVYAPVFRKQIKIAESDGINGDDYRVTAHWGVVLGLAITAIDALIVFLMVAKPSLW